MDDGVERMQESSIGLGVHQLWEVGRGREDSKMLSLEELCYQQKKERQDDCSLLDVLNTSRNTSRNFLQGTGGIEYGWKYGQLRAENFEEERTDN